MFNISRFLTATFILWLFTTTASADVLQYVLITDTRFPSNNPPSATWTLSDDYGGTPLNAWITYTGDDTWSTITTGTYPDVAFPYGQAYATTTGIGTVQAVYDDPLNDEYTNGQHTAFWELNVQSLDTSSSQTMEVGLTDLANEVKWDEAAGTVSGSKSGLSGDDVTGIPRWSALGSFPLHVQFYYHYSDYILTYILKDNSGNTLYTGNWQGSVNPFQNFYGSAAVPGGTDPNNLMVYPFVFCEAACQTSFVKAEYLNCTTNAGAVDVSSCTSPNQSVISTSTGSGGSISPVQATVNNGSTASFTVTPDSGYYISSVSGCGGSLSGNTYTTGAVSADCTVSAAFTTTNTTTYTVTTTASSGGSISPGSTTVGSGLTAVFTVTPDSGYHTTSVTGCGGSLSGNTYTTGAITADCSVNATFADTYTVSATSGSGGSISPVSASVIPGGTTTFTLTPNSGYYASSATGCGGTLSGNSYTTGPISADCSVTANFASTSSANYTVTATASSGGSISPGSTTVGSGLTAVLTVTPDSGYHTTSVTGCGGSLSGNTYTTGPITANCSIEANFGDTYTVTGTAGSGGGISPVSASVNPGNTAIFTLTPDTGYQIDSVSGCNGTLSGDTYTTASVSSDCTVTASFTTESSSSSTTTTSSGGGGALNPWALLALLGLIGPAWRRQRAFIEK